MTRDSTETVGARAANRRVIWSARLGLALIRVLGWTWRVQRVNVAGQRALLTDRQGHVLAVWHGDLLPAVWGHRGDPLVALVSEHRDGEIIARIIAGLGFTTARGSTTRGGSRALLTLVRALEGGACAAFTPDGPRGPRHVLQPGMLAAAKRTHAPIVVIGVAVSRCWRFRSWDQFVVPKPFARIVLAYSSPSLVDPAVSDISAAVPLYTALMHDATATAERELARG